MRSLALLITLFSSGLLWAAKPDLLKLRPVAKSPSPTTEKIAGLEIEKTALIDGGDCIHADPSFTEGAWVLNVSVTPAAGKRLGDYTRAHVGDRMAFFIEGELLRAPRIMDPIEVDGFLVGTFTREKATELAKHINEWVDRFAGGPDRERILWRGEVLRRPCTVRTRRSDNEAPPEKTPGDGPRAKRLAHE